MSPETTTELTRLNIRLPRSLHLQFKSMVVAEGKSIQEVLSEFIEDYVERRRQPRRGGTRK